MNRVGGKTAFCDRDGCTEKVVVQKGDDPIWVLEWAGWEVRSDWKTPLADPDLQLFCPTHKAGGYDPARVLEAA